MTIIKPAEVVRGESNGSSGFFLPFSPLFELFVFSIPSLDLLFPFNGGSWAGCFFKIHQSGNIILISKTAFVQMVSMLIDTPDQIIGNAGIQHAVIRICQNIYVESHSIDTFP